jgi:hypothetical protein
MDENFFNLRILKCGMICPHTAKKKNKKQKKGEFISLVK